MSGLDLFKEQLSMKAKSLPDYDESEIDKGKITRWADGYCDACDSGDEAMKDAYISALMLKFWHRVPDIYAKVKATGAYDYEDCASVLFESIATACSPKYRAWRKNPKLSAQACINQTLATRGVAAIIYESNLSRGQANAPANQVRLDDKLPDGDAPVSDMYGTRDPIVGGEAKALIQSMIDEGNVVEAIILDSIAFDESMRISKSKRVWTDMDGKSHGCKTSTAEFWSRKLVRSLTKLPAGYLAYFTGAYEVSQDSAEAAISKIAESNTTKLHRFVDKALISAKAVAERI